jgi:hypothetical protein
MQQPAADTAALSRRRELLFSGVAALAGCAAVAAPPSRAAVTITMRPKSQLKPYTLKAGYTVTAPDTWGLAYVSGARPCLVRHTGQQLTPAFGLRPCLACGLLKLRLRQCTMRLPFIRVRFGYIHLIAGPF